MKNLFTILFFAIVANSYGQQKSFDNPVTADEVAIKKLFEDEARDFNAVNYESYLSHWAKVPYASFLYREGLFVGDGLWKKMDEFWKNRKPSNVKRIRTNWNLRINGNSAFVTYNQRNENLETKDTGDNYEERYMEKIDGTWKIVNVTVWQLPTK